MMRPGRSAQRGVALLTALLIIALVGIIGAGMITQMNLYMHRSGNLWLDEQAWWYAVGVENWITQILQLDAENSDIDALTEAWAQPVDYLPIEGGAIQGRIVDLQARFNLNNLGAGGEAEAAMFQRLLQGVADTDALTAQTITQSIKDWIDADINPTLPYGAEDDYYLGLSPAYRTANRAMVSASELRAVNGVTDQIYRALSPYVTALPTRTAINVNTAAPALLAALAPDLRPADVEVLVETREKEPWSSVQSFLGEDALAGRDIPAEGLSVTTGYFQVVGTVALDRGQLRFRSRLARGDSGQTRVIAHSRNVD